jgi:hypothetical protein
MAPLFKRENKVAVGSDAYKQTKSDFTTSNLKQSPTAALPRFGGTFSGNRAVVDYSSDYWDWVIGII